LVPERTRLAGLLRRELIERWNQLQRAIPVGFARREDMGGRSSRDRGTQAARRDDYKLTVHLQHWEILTERDAQIEWVITCGVVRGHYSGLGLERELG
jgi:hypothetical protein